MSIQSARNVAEFVHILARDSENRPARFLVPGHEGRRYEVTLERDNGLRATCEQLDRVGIGLILCQGNQHCVCYHVLASCIVAASEQGKELSWCESQADAERLSNIDGQVFTVKSAQSGKVAYGVVRDTDMVSLLAKGIKELSLLTKEARDTKPELAPAGLPKSELVDLAVNLTRDKLRWFNGESERVAEDAFLKNDGHQVNLYRSDKSGKYPKVTRLATVFWLDPGNIEAGWQRHTEARQARAELFNP